MSFWRERYHPQNKLLKSTLVAVLLSSQLPYDPSVWKPIGYSHIKFMGLLMVPFSGKICGLDPPTVFQSKMNTVIVLGASWGTVLRNKVTYLNSTDFGRSEGWKWIGHTPTKWDSGTWKELVFKTSDIQPCHFSKGTLSQRSSPNLLHDMKLLLHSHTSIIKAQMQKKLKVHINVTTTVFLLFQWKITVSTM